MPGVHGHLKISLIGKPGALARVEDVVSSLKSYTGQAERFLELWQYAYQCPVRATHGLEMVTVDEFWENVTPVMNLLIELGKSMPELEIQSVCRVAGAITDVKCLFTVVKARESNEWACPTWQNIDMAGAVLEVKFPEADMRKQRGGANEKQ